MLAQSRAGQLIRHVGSVAAAGAALGAVNAAATAQGIRGASELGAAIQGAGLLTLVSLPLGAAQFVIAWAVTRSPSLNRLLLRWSNAEATPADSPPSVRRTALALALAAVFAVVLAAAWWASGFVAPIQVAVLRRVVLVFIVGGALVAGAVLVIAVEPTLARGIEQLTRRGWWPFPRAVGSRILLFVGMPTLLVFWRLLTRYEDELAFLLRPLGLLLALQIDVALLTLTRPTRLKVGGYWVAVVLVLVGIAFAQPWLVGLTKGATQTLATGTFTAPALRLLRKLTDSDGDGYSAWFAGGDCAPRNRAIHPGAVDRLDNGVDENCDGVSAVVAAAPPPAPAWPKLLPGSQKRHYNVLWIVVDALRADHLQLYGYHRGNTPSLMRLAESALVFDNAYSPSSTTHLSFPSLLTGRNVANLTWEYRDDPVRLEPDARQRTVAQRLQALGYRREAIVSPFIAHLPAILAGFESVHTEHRQRFVDDGAGATMATIDALQRASATPEQPFFILTYYEDPHLPYDAHGPEFPSYGADPRAVYDGEIAFVDRYLGMLLDYLKAHVALERDTIVVVTSDHGEEFGERGGSSHGKTCYEESTRVPLLLRVPGLKPMRVPAPVAAIDIAPTLLDLIGAAPSSGDFDGRSLVAAAEPQAPQKAIYCAITNQGSTLIGRPFLQRSVRFGNRALVHELISGTYELFDSVEDRGQRRDISAEPGEQATLARMKQLLDGAGGGNLLDKRLGR